LIRTARTMGPRHLALGSALTAVAVSAGFAAGATADPGNTTVAAALKSAKAPASQLEATRTVHLGDATVTRYAQEVGGVAVLGGDVVVVDDQGSAPEVVTDASTAAVAAPPEADVSAAEAIAIARSASGASGNRAAPTAKLAIDPDQGGALVRRVVIASQRPLKDFEVTIDAASGEVLATRNLLRYATGSAQLYTPNPIATNGGYDGIGRNKDADKNDKDTAKLTSLRTPVVLDRLDSGDCLTGTYVKSRLGDRNGKPVCKPSRNWDEVTRANDRFEALMGYYHIDVIQDYMNDIGFSGANDVHPGPITSIADNFKADQSFYSPGDGKMHYGEGGVDDAEDGDVIVHEFGHAIQDAQVPGYGKSDQARSLGEGFGDFMSALNQFISPPAPDLEEAEYCIFDWDGTGGYGGPGVKPCGRLATGENSDGSTDTYGEAKFTCKFGGSLEVHCFGEVWAQGLINLLNDIPTEVGIPPIAKDVLASQFLYSKDESYKEAVNHLLDADMLNYGGTHIAAICNEMDLQRAIPGTDCT
jgi:Zn-dependent metalloprotease